jgi:hypothetical protein
MGKPKDIFSPGDRIKVTSKQSKHYNRTAVITGVGSRRLTVAFDKEDPRPGLYVDFKDAKRIEPKATATDKRPKTTQHRERLTTKGGNDIGELTQMLEHLAFATATLISSESDDPEQLEIILGLFTQQVRTHHYDIASMKQNRNTH